MLALNFKTLMMMAQVSDKIASFVQKKRQEAKVPWYKRPIEYSAFRHRKGIDGKYYLQHNEWSKRVWIGPYNTMDEINSIMDSYVIESLKGSINTKTSEKIHSVIIDNADEFFC